MKIVCISDLHEQFPEMPEGDMVICAGDITMMGDYLRVVKFYSWFWRLPYKHKIFIAGNHDFCFEIGTHPPVPMELTYLSNQGINLNGTIIWGSPMTPTFGDWAFMEDRGHKIRKYWDLIPVNTDILITHGPPLGILDKTPRHQEVGCQDLRFAVNEIKPKLHVFGHIHHSYGVFKNEHTTFVNASICNEDYEPVNKPIVVEIGEK